MFRKQQTIGKPVSFSGIGIHQGCEVSLTLFPAAENTGRVFRRDDLIEKPLIPALAEQVFANPRSTSIGTSELYVQTVEHLLAALYACRIDNVVIALTAAEPPIGNGSSDVFVSLIQEAGIVEQQAYCSLFSVDTPLYCSDETSTIIALPYQGYKISYLLDYPQSKCIGTQYRSFEITQDIFIQELAPCRTFALESEVQFLKERGLIKGGSLDNAVVVGEEKIHAKGGLFFPDEMVRHKILDVVGDLALVGGEICAHIVSIKSGHKTNCLLAKEIVRTTAKKERTYAYR